MKRWLALAGWAVWAAGSLAATLLMRRGVIQEPVHIKLADGTSVRGTLCRPRTDERDLPIAVLLHGTAAGRQMCIPGMALPLARHGYLALAIDLCGHGDSGGAVPRDELDSLTADTRRHAEHAEVEAALDFIKRHPLFIGQHPCGYFHCIGLVGHSRGGWLAMDTAYGRADVDGVVTVGAAPLVCDTIRPRNLLFLTGAHERLCPLSMCVAALRQATGGAVAQPEVAYGNFWSGNARRLMCVNTADHLTEMTHPAVTTRVVEWLDTSLHIIPSDRRANSDVGYLLYACLAATLGGLAGAAAIVGILGRWLLGGPKRKGTKRKGTGPLKTAQTKGPVPFLLGPLQENQPERTNGNAWRLALFAALLIAVVPLAASMSKWVEIGPVYFCGPGTLLFAGVACACVLCAGSQFFRVFRVFRGSTSVAAVPDVPWRGVLLGVLTLVLGAIWLGVPWGITWLQLLPTPRRLVLVLALFPMMLPAGLALAWALQRLVGNGGPLLAASAWCTVAGVLWLTNHFLVEPRHPLFTVPLLLTVASFVVPWPLWMMRYRAEATLARGLSHAGALAWLLACHLPFVSSG